MWGEPDSPPHAGGCHAPGAYEAVLRTVCEQDADDPDWALREDWQDEVANALHDIKQAEKLAALRSGTGSRCIAKVGNCQTICRGTPRCSNTNAARPSVATPFI